MLFERKNTMKIPIKKLEYRNEAPFTVNVVNARHIPVHRHEKELEIIFCMSGSATIITAHDRLEIHPNEIVTLDYEDIHCIYSDVDNKLVIFNVDLSQSDIYPWEDLRYRYFTCYTHSVRSYNRNYHDRVRAILLASAYLYASGKKYKKEEYMDVYERLLKLLVNGFSWPYREDVDAEMNDEIKERINNVHTYLQQNYMNKITISELSDMNGISENYFSQFMKKTSYGGFKEMVAYIRCYHAEQYLLTTDLSGEEISNMCGFSSTKYFYRWFRHFWGVSPLQHKKWYKAYMEEEDNFYEYEKDEILPIIEKWIADDLTTSVFGL